MEPSDQMRLFVGLSLPDMAKQKIMALPRLKLNFKHQTHPDDLHLTLRFIGNAAPDKLDDIIEALSTMKKCQKFTLSMNGLDLFEKRDKGVLVAEIEQNKKLSQLEQTITAQIGRIGLAGNARRGFHPHVTIARINGDGNVEDYKKKYGATLRSSWPVTEFYLYRSEDRSGGDHRYSVIERFPLSPY